MAVVTASNTIVGLARETTYGTAVTTPTVLIPDMMDYTFGNEQITLPQKTQTLAPMVNTSYEGRKVPTVTLSGVLTYSHLELLTAMFGDAATPYVIGTDDVATGAVGYSYTIIQAIPVASDDLGDGVLALGCRLETLNFTKNGAYIGYTATFKAKSIDDNVSFGAYTATTTYPELVPYLWQDVTCALMDDTPITKLNTFSLDLVNEYVDDDLSFQNSETRNSLEKCATNGTLTAEWIYDTTKDAVVYDNLLSQTLKTDVISFVNAVATWAITTEGQYTDYSKPDKDKCLFTGNFTKQIAGKTAATAVAPISIAITVH